MYIALLGRQPALGMAELERLYGGEHVRWFSDITAVVDAPHFNFNRLGGSQKAGRVIAELPRGDWRQVSMKIVRHYADAWAHASGKITLGISAYGFPASARDIQKTGIILKQKLKANGVSLRLLPNVESALGTATSHHNKLGLAANKVELLVIRASDGRIIVAESVGAQNITAIAARDQARPYTDAFVGMLPPKLARMMVNMITPVNPSLQRAAAKSPEARVEASLHDEDCLSVASSAVAKEASTQAPRRDEQPLGERDELTEHNTLTLLDPFCGTGVVLQEAALLGYRVYGTDLADKMVDYSAKNLAWLADQQHITIASTIEQGNAMSHQWQQPIDAVACETYLGQPFSAPPSPAKLREVRGNCNHIVSEFLKNISEQLKPGTPLCVAVPAWRDKNGNFAHLPLVDQLEALGYRQHQFTNINNADLLYYREDQVVARELLVIEKL